MLAQEESTVKRKKRIGREEICGTLFAFLPLLGFVLFTIVPVSIAFATMFTSMQGNNLSTMEWNNFENFKIVFTDKTFWASFLTSIIMIIPHFLGLLLSLVISAILAQKFPGSKVFKTLFFIPYVCSSVAVAIMWQWMFDVNYGIINTVLGGLFGEGAKVAWMTKAVPFRTMLIIVMVWQAPGYGIVMFSAAFTGVNQSLYEAAQLDGAGKLRQFFSITLPSISPTIYYLITTGLLAGLQTFDIVRIFAGDSWTGAAGPSNAGLTTVLDIYNQGVFKGMPVASVMSFVFFIFIFTIMQVNKKLSKRWVHEGY